MTYLATPKHKNPNPKGHEIYNFVHLSLDINTILSLSDLCLGVEKNNSIEIIYFPYIYNSYGHTLAERPLPQES